MNITQKRKTDVLIVGAGAAGLRAALAAAEAGSSVVITNKGPVGKSGITLTAAGGMQAPFHPEDSAQQFFNDTIKNGYGLGDQNLAMALAGDACARALDAAQYGVQFVKDTDGGFMLRQFPGQSQPRNLFIRGGGVGLVSQLFKACKAHGNIQIVDDFFVTGLLKGHSAGENSVVGVVGLNLKSGDLTLISAKAVVLATGGCQWLWEINDCPADATGDGVAYAYRAGAQLVDMEMILFYPSVIVWPPSLKGAFVHYEFLDPAILDGNIYDKEGRAVLPKPLPVRDEAMRLMQQAIREGRGTDHGGLLWYVGDSPKGAEAVQKALNIAQYNYIKAHGVNPATDKIEVAPGAHYLLGGIHIDEKCQTSLKGLFATPECAGNFDGANRLAGSGITATQVFGARAGLYAHSWAAATRHQEAAADSVEEETERVAARIMCGNARPSNIYRLKDKLRAAAQLYAGVNRDQDGLQHLVKRAAEIRDELSREKALAVTYNQQLVDLLQLDSMCELAGLIAGSALMRQESRGHHYRTDFPRQDDANWLAHTCVVKGPGGPAFGEKPVIRI